MLQNCSASSIKSTEINQILGLLFHTIYNSFIFLIIPSEYSMFQKVYLHGAQVPIVVLVIQASRWLLLSSHGSSCQVSSTTSGIGKIDNITSTSRMKKLSTWNCRVRSFLGFCPYIKRQIARLKVCKRYFRIDALVIKTCKESNKAQHLFYGFSHFSDVDSFSVNMNKNVFWRWVDLKRDWIVKYYANHNLQEDTTIKLPDEILTSKKS